jgi:hypothetical protein
LKNLYTLWGAYFNTFMQHSEIVYCISYPGKVLSARIGIDYKLKLFKTSLNIFQRAGGWGGESALDIRLPDLSN